MKVKKSSAMHLIQEALKGDILKKGGHLKTGFRSEIVGFALRPALDTSILMALSKAIPQGKRCLERESAVTAQCAEKCRFEMSWFKMWWFSAPPLMTWHVAKRKDQPAS